MTKITQILEDIDTMIGGPISEMTLEMTEIQDHLDMMRLVSTLKSQPFRLYHAGAS